MLVSRHHSPPCGKRIAIANGERCPGLVESGHGLHPLSCWKDSSGDNSELVVFFAAMVVISTMLRVQFSKKQTKQPDPGHRLTKTGAMCHAHPWEGKDMPLTKLDTTAALIVIDLQKSIVGLPPVPPAGEMIGRPSSRAPSASEVCQLFLST